MTPEQRLDSIRERTVWWSGLKGGLGVGWTDRNAGQWWFERCWEKPYWVDEAVYNSILTYSWILNLSYRFSLNRSWHSHQLLSTHRRGPLCGNLTASYSKLLLTPGITIAWYTWWDKTSWMLSLGEVPASFPCYLISVSTKTQTS